MTPNINIMLKFLKFGPLKTDSYHKNTLRINLDAILQYRLHNKRGEPYEWAPEGHIAVFGVIFGQNLSI